MFTSAAQLLGTAATAYGVLAALTTLLQARQMLARGTSCEVSGRFFASYAGGYAIWLVYGLSTGNLPLITVDAVGLLCAGLTLAVALSLRGSLLHPATWTSCTDPRPNPRPAATPDQRAVSAGGGGRHRLSELVTGARRMRAPAAFASDPTTQPAYVAQNRPEQRRPSQDRAWGFTPRGRPGTHPVMTGVQPTIATGRSVVAQAQSRPPRTWRRSQSAGRQTWLYRTGHPERLPALSSLPAPRALIGVRRGITIGRQVAPVTLG